MTNILSIQVVNSPDDAPNYRRDFIDIQCAHINKAIIVCNGTKSGNPTVDLQFTAEDGSQFVAMINGELIRQLAIAIQGAQLRSASNGTGLIQAFWMELANIENVKFIAQGGPFSDADLMAKWISETFEQHKEERKDGWEPMVCDEHSHYFVKQAKPS